MSAEPRCLDAGEAALVVEFGDTVDPALHDRVLALEAALAARPPAGLRETVPTYRSLMVHYDPLVLARADLVVAVRAATAGAVPKHQVDSLWVLPCCYDRAHAEDLDAIAEITGLTAEQVVATHAGTAYRIYMYGFAPGFCYLGGVPEALKVSRRPSPRPPHPPGAIMLGGGLSLISTVSMPTGWYVAGRTPERMFDVGREPPTFAAIGDLVRFEPVGRAEFAGLEARVAAGERVARREQPLARREQPA